MEVFRQRCDMLIIVFHQLCMQSVENVLWRRVRGNLGESADRKRVEARTIVLH